jgi:flavin reductase (DIM6/NTAB) family NADH-FMN oxidoreductase RutF
MTSSAPRSGGLVPPADEINQRAAGVDAQAFRAAMRIVATPVTVIATGEADARHGMTASAVCSLSDQPPMIIACVNSKSAVLPYIRTNGCFTANFLAEAQSAVAERFAGMTKVFGPERFELGSWGRLATGAPVLQGALAVFDCRLVREYDSPTHAVLVGRVEAILHESASRSLIYAGGKFSFPQVL